MSKKKIAVPCNIWAKERFLQCCYGKKFKIIAIIKHIWKCLRWSKQRATRGYADCDRWNMFEFLQTLLPDMLQDFRENHGGAPLYLGENYYDEDGMMVNDTCGEEWNQILDRMIFLWRESREETSTKKNPDEEEYRNK